MRHRRTKGAATVKRISNATAPHLYSTGYRLSIFDVTLASEGPLSFLNRQWQIGSEIVFVSQFSIAGQVSLQTVTIQIATGK